MKKLFYNGNFISMDENIQEFQALLTYNGMIKATGDYEFLLKSYPDATLIDLDGKTLMPSFIDAHSHFSGYAMSLLEVNLDFAKSFDDICNQLTIYLEENQIADGEWLIGGSYDHNSLAENTHPTCNILDKVSIDIPIVIKHKSGHFGVFNSKALELLNINYDNSKDIEGIFFDNEKPTGYIEENPFIDNVKRIPMASLEKIFIAFNDIQNVYASYGITTAQEGMLVKELVPLYKQYFANKHLNIDLVAYADVKEADAIYDEMKKFDGEYVDNFRIGGVKTFLDGSPQGRTAFMLTPYKNSDVEFFGNQTTTKEDLAKEIRYASENNLQLLAHCNGDGASRMFIDAIKNEYLSNESIVNTRPVIVHAQLLNLNQLAEVKEYNIIPSFFVAHTKYWGDVHIGNFGYDRASLICPTNSALENDILFTFHQDSPVINADMLETVQCATTRITKGNIALGESERIEVYEALKAITINAAYQYFEENKKGTLAVGKYADLIILDRNPLDIAKSQISKIKVLETIKQGKTIYRYEENSVR